MTTVEALFEEFKKLPDWDRYPMPEVFYQHFNVKKPQPATLTEVVNGYNPPPYQSLNVNGKVEIREPAEGGVREVKDFAHLPVEVKRLNEETNELEDYPQLETSLTSGHTEHLLKLQEILKENHFTTQISSCMTECSVPDSETPPTIGATKDSLHELDRECPGLSGAYPYIVNGLPYHQSK